MDRVYAPELVVFTAWRQWCSARLLGNVVKDLDALAEADTEEEYDGCVDRNGGRSRVLSEYDCLSMKKRKARRRYPWTMTHNFFASTGGFAFEIRVLMMWCPMRKALTIFPQMHHSV